MRTMLAVGLGLFSLLASAAVVANDREKSLGERRKRLALLVINRAASSVCTRVAMVKKASRRK